MFEKLISLFSGESFQKSREEIKKMIAEQQKNTHLDGIRYINEYFVSLLRVSTEFYEKHKDFPDDRESFIHCLAYYNYFNELVEAVKSCYYLWDLGDKDLNVCLWKNIKCSRPLYKGLRETSIIQFEYGREFLDAKNKPDEGKVDTLYFDYLFGTSSMSKLDAITPMSHRLIVELLVFFDFFVESIRVENPKWTSYTQEVVLEKFIKFLQTKSTNDYNLLKKIFKVFFVEGVTFSESFSELNRGEYELPIYFDSDWLGTQIKWIIRHNRIGTYTTVDDARFNVVATPSSSNKNFHIVRMEGYKGRARTPFDNPQIFKEINLEFLY